MTGEYADAVDPALRDRPFPRIETGDERAVDLVTTVTGHDDPIRRDRFATNPARRNSYVDPLDGLPKTARESRRLPRA